MKSQRSKIKKQRWMMLYFSFLIFPLSSSLAQVGQIGSTGIDTVGRGSSQNDILRRTYNANFLDFVTVGSSPVIVKQSSSPGVAQTGHLNISGDAWAGHFYGDGSGLTGIGTGTGGVINAGSTTVGADSNEDGVGVIDLQTRNSTRLRIQNNGNVDVISETLHTPILVLDPSSPFTGGLGVRRSNGATVPLFDYDEDVDILTIGDSASTYQTSTKIYGGSGDINLYTKAATSVNIEKMNGIVLGTFTNSGLFAWGATATTDSTARIDGSFHVTGNTALDGATNIDSLKARTIITTGKIATNLPSNVVGAAISGISLATSGTNYGVYGGSAGTAGFSVGLYGNNSAGGYGVLGNSNTGIGGYFKSTVTAFQADVHDSVISVVDSNGVYVRDYKGKTALKIKQFGSGLALDVHNASGSMFTIADDGQVSAQDVSATSLTSSGTVTVNKLKINSVGALMDSAKVISDSLFIWIGGTAYGMKARQ